MKTSIRRLLNWMRWPNLLIVVVTLAFIRYGLVAPALHLEGFSLELSPSSFVLLTLVTLLITFGGYVINDIFDQATDAQNKPDNQAIGNWISPGKAKAVYLTVSFLGFLISIYLANEENKWQWLWIYPLAVLLLWWYSKRLKGTVLLGNIVVSIFCSGVALLIPFSEKEAIILLNEGQNTMLLLFFYAGFAGISNLLREIIKDAEDIEGDHLAGLKTLAVKHGLAASRNWALAVGLLLGIGLLLFYMEVHRSSNWAIGFFYLTVPLLIAILLGFFRIPGSINWKMLSKLSKYLMLGGLLGMLFLI